MGTKYPACNAKGGEGVAQFLIFRVKSKGGVDLSVQIEEKLGVIPQMSLYQENSRCSGILILMTSPQEPHTCSNVLTRYIIFLRQSFVSGQEACQYAMLASIEVLQVCLQEIWAHMSHCWWSAHKCDGLGWKDGYELLDNALGE